MKVGVSHDEVSITLLVINCFEKTKHKVILLGEGIMLVDLSEDRLVIILLFYEFEFVFLVTNGDVMLQPIFPLDRDKGIPDCFNLLFVVTLIEFL